MLLKKDVVWKWEQEQSISFQALKDSYKDTPVLCHADFNRPFILEADASDFAIAGVLSQEVDGALKPIAFYSRKLQPAELNYPIYDKELLAIVAGFSHWRSYLASSSYPVTVYTDHKNLLFFSTSRKLNRRQVRWSLFLSDFKFEIVYRPGKEGGKPDALSRRPDYGLTDDDHSNQVQVLLPQTVFRHMGNTFLMDAGESQSVEPESATLLQDIKTAQEIDEQIRELSKKEVVTKHDDIWMFSNRIYVPRSMVVSVLKLCHDSPLAGHSGQKKTLVRVLRSFWWPTVRVDVRKFVESCTGCKRNKTVRQKPAGLLHPLPVPPRPWHSLSMDMIVDLPMTGQWDSILVVVDRLTKFAHFIPCAKTLDSAGLADLFIQNVIKLHGLPNNIVSDRGSIFVSQFWSAIMMKLNIKQCLSSAYHPESDGQTERVNQCLEQYLRIYSDYQQTNWASTLPLAELVYHSQHHVSIKMSPVEALYGYAPPDDLSCEILDDVPPTAEEFLNNLKVNQELLKIEMELAQAEQKKHADVHRRDLTLEVGQKVFLNRKNIKTTRPCLKLDYKQLGPFMITDKINDVAYRLALPESMSKLHNVFHVSLLDPATDNPFPDRIEPPPPPVTIDDNEEWEVAEILDSRVRHKKLQYLVAWKNFGPESNTWEPAENLMNAPEVSAAFHARFPDKPGPIGKRGGTVRPLSS